MKACFSLCLVFLLLLSACRKEFEPTVTPGIDWDLFNSAPATPLALTARQAMEGVYRVTSGSDRFGDQVALKWSYDVTNSDTIFYCSLFSNTDITHIIMKGKRSGDSLLLSGFWRKMINTQTGTIRLVIPYSQGARQLSMDLPFIQKDSIIITGLMGDGAETPALPVQFAYDRKLFSARPFQILAHRGGGRTSDLLPVSENSVGMVKYASRLGATGIEIDVRMTKDGVPILYHDNTLNLRLIQKNGLVGDIATYSYDQLYTFVRLIDGQHIPTLREALYAVVYETPLEFVWLDTKYEGPQDQVRALQQEFLQKAKDIGRKLEIVIGLPSEEALNSFKQLPDYPSIPSLCELSTDQVAEVNAKIWGPRWTEGLQNESVAGIQAQGRRAFVWTLDVPGYVDQYINEGHWDGILSNYASLVAYYNYVR